ncbi:MAG TPA: hypothetical protein VJQ54_17635, partial [Candidatus Sulfotelmatobacter sp.]|nr:hypothetical protein [Candidatus Sulfotelmatobacter sp.]
MKHFRLLGSLLILGSLLAYGQVTINTPEKTTPKAPAKPNELPPELQGRPQLSKQTRIELIRTLQAEFGFAKKLFPKGDKGLQLTSSGQISPDDQSIMMQVASNGPAAKPGDKLQITDVVIKGSEIVFDINGGSKRKGHWFDHIEVGGGGGMVPVHQEKGAANPGCTLALVFPKYVPEMTTADVKKLLEPVIDFSVKSPTQAYIDTLPPKLKTSIENHQVLVGMSKEMVIDAVGRPPKRIRESQDNVDYEEWIYGEPPGDVQFIRFVNEEVIRVEHSQVGGETTVKTAREVKVNAVTGAATMIDANAPQTVAAAQPEEAPQPAQAKKPPKAPTLRRAGEQPEDQKAAASMPGELGSKPIPAGGSTQEPEWGTKPAQTAGTTQTGTPQNQSPTTSSPDAPLPGPGSLPPV